MDPFFMPKDEAIDAIDNGINQYDTNQPPRYVKNTHLSSRVGKVNLDWIDPDQSSEKENEAFERAMTIAGREFLDVIDNVQEESKNPSVLLETRPCKYGKACIGLVTWSAPRSLNETPLYMPMIILSILFDISVLDEWMR